MNLKRRELIITIIAMVAVLVVALSSSVFADSNGKNLTLGDLLNNTTDNVDVENKVENKTENSIIKVVTGNNTNENSNSSTEFNKAGLEDLPVLAFVGCAVVAVFAFKKIKEYKSY